MRLLVLAAFVLSGEVLPSGVPLALEDQADATSFLQVQVSVQVQPNQSSPWPNFGPCSTPHWLDLFRPIPTVLAENPDTNGNCYFKFHADYLGDSPEYQPDFFLATVMQFTPAKNGMEATIHSVTGENLTTHLDNMWGSYPYDDGMCYAEGWLKGQSLDGLDFTNTAAVYERAERDCEKMRQRNNWTGYEREVTAGAMVFDNVRIMRAAECAAGAHGKDCVPATMRDYDMHLYPKCLLGGEYTLTTQMVWCYARACLLEGNVIKHGKECYPDGLPAWLGST